MNHYQKCLARVRARAAELRAAVQAGRLQENAVEGLLRSFVDQPAYYVADCESLISEALR